MANLGIISAIILIVAVVGVSAYFGGYLGQAVGGDISCKDVFCNDQNQICCGLRLDSQNSAVKLSAPDHFQCPTSASYCEVTVSSATHPSSTHDEFAVGSLNCRKNNNCIFGLCIGDTWKCDDESYQRTTPFSITHMNPGQYVYSVVPQEWIVINYKVYTLSLVDCGRSKCVSGDDKISGGSILGATGCSFVPSNLADRVYNQAGQLLTSPKLSQIVPTGECYAYTTYSLRRVCGSTCEYCDTDTDCSSNYPIKYTTNGITYGATCQSGQLQLYGCKKQSDCLEYDNTILGNKCVKTTEKSWCEQVKTVAVQCCPGTNICGTNEVCDPKTYTCVSSGVAQCSRDSDCGNTGEVCDWNTKKMTSAKCQSGKCVTVTGSSVECCSSANCGTGYYCGTDYKCKQEVSAKSNCPYGCCVDEIAYNDRPCSNSAYTCCADHTCKVSCEDVTVKCNNNDKCEPKVGETLDNCPNDCAEDNFFTTDTIVMIAIGVFALLVVVLIGIKVAKK
jgi:hypothetical protein